LGNCRFVLCCLVPASPVNRPISRIRPCLAYRLVLLSIGQLGSKMVARRSLTVQPVWRVLLLPYQGVTASAVMPVFVGCLHLGCAGWFRTVAARSVAIAVAIKGRHVAHANRVSCWPVKGSPPCCCVLAAVESLPARICFAFAWPVHTIPPTQRSARRPSCHAPTRSSARPRHQPPAPRAEFGLSGRGLSGRHRDPGSIERIGVDLRRIRDDPRRGRFAHSTSTEQVVAPRISCLFR
jgi:hypothetical protein